MQGKILVIYYSNMGYPLRASSYDLLYCFEKYSDCLCYYVNAAFGIPKALRNIDFDLIVLQEHIMTKRSLPRRFAKIMERCRILKEFKGYKIALVQDEFAYTKDLNEFINEFDVRHIFSVAQSTQWGKIYSGIDRNKVKIDTVLTGYLDSETVQKINLLAKEVDNRKVDIGYRANFVKSYYWGSHGLLKYKIADEFQKYTPSYDLTVDISTKREDTILGFNWYRFLLNCKYTIGVETGASLHDPDGKIETCVNEYLEKNPSASFEEVENACFKGHDFNLNLYAIGPRHLEACVTKTCQILIEGEYNDILKPGEHYIALKKDFSNLDEVIQIVKDNKQREAIVEKAYRDIVESEKYTYKNFVEEVINKSLGKDYRWSDISEEDHQLYEKNKKREQLIWKYIPIRSFVIKSIVNILPAKIFNNILKYMKT